MQFISKTVGMMDRGLFKNAAQMNLNVLSTKHFTEEAWSLITSSTIKNCFTKCGFSIYHISSNNNSALKMMIVTM
jgi:hypothetical protein